MPQKQIGTLLAVLGAMLIIGSMVVVNAPDYGKWFPVLLIVGVGCLWYGIRKYREAY